MHTKQQQRAPPPPTPPPHARPHPAAAMSELELLRGARQAVAEGLISSQDYDVVKVTAARLWRSRAVLRMHKLQQARALKPAVHTPSLTPPS
jgi:hypothetical protein